MIYKPADGQPAAVTPSDMDRTQVRRTVTDIRHAVIVRGEHIIVRRGCKSIACLDAVAARDLGADLVLAAEALLATAPWVSSDPGVEP